MKQWPRGATRAGETRHGIETFSIVESSREDGQQTGLGFEAGRIFGQVGWRDQSSGDEADRACAGLHQPRHAWLRPRYQHLPRGAPDSAIANQCSSEDEHSSRSTAGLADDIFSLTAERPEIHCRTKVARQPQRPTGQVPANRRPGKSPRSSSG